MEHQNDKKAIQENLREQFNGLGEDITAPESLKKEVFNTLDTLTLLGDFVDLFTAKFAQSELNVIDTLNDDSQENDDLDD